MHYFALCRALSSFPLPPHSAEETKTYSSLLGGGAILTLRESQQRLETFLVITTQWGGACPTDI